MATEFKPTYPKSFISNDAVTDTVSQLTKSDLSYFTLIFLALKTAALFALWKMWRDNVEYENIIKKNQFLQGQHGIDQGSVNT